MSKGKDYIKKHKHAFIISMSVTAIALCVITFLLVLFLVFDFRTENDAVNIAKSNFGCDDVLWVGSALGDGNSLDSDSKLKSGNYYVISEKGDDQIFLHVPSSKLKKPIELDWMFDYSYEQIVGNVNEYLDSIDMPKFVGDSGSNSMMLVTGKPESLKTELDKNGDSYDDLDFDVALRFYVMNEKSEAHVYAVQSNRQLKIYSVSYPDV